MRMLLLAALVCGASTTLFSQSPDFTIRVPDVSGTEQAIVTVELDSLGGTAQGFSLGICNDDTLVYPFDVQLGADLVTVDPSFWTAEWNDTFASGGVIIDSMGSTQLPPGLGFQVFDVSYSMVGSAGSVADLTLCTAPTPTRTLTVVISDGQAVFPILDNGSVTILATDTDPPATGGGTSGGSGGGSGGFPAPTSDATFSINDVTASERGTVMISLENNGAATTGWSFSVCNDPGELYPYEAVAGPDGGEDYDYWFVALWEDGVQCLAVRDLVLENTVPAGDLDLL
ncbi:MAG: hypothetical protein AAF488_18460, partial [Planctomycetota bacterium]